MTTSAKSFATQPMVLRLSTAAELMTRNPLSFDKSMPIHAAIALLDSNGLAEAPVVDEFNRPEGVVTRAACVDWQEFCVRSSPYGFTSEGFDQTTIDEIANPVIKTVHSDDAIVHDSEVNPMSFLNGVANVNESQWRVPSFGKDRSKWNCLLTNGCALQRNEYRVPSSRRNRPRDIEQPCRNSH